MEKEAIFAFGFLSFILGQCLGILIGVRVRLKSKHPWANLIWLSRQFRFGTLILALIVLSQGVVMFFFGNVWLGARVIDVVVVIIPLGAVVGFFIGKKEAPK